MSEYKLAVSGYKLAVSDTYRSFFFKKININWSILHRYTYRIRVGHDSLLFFLSIGASQIQINK